MPIEWDVDGVIGVDYGIEWDIGGVIGREAEPAVGWAGKVDGVSSPAEVLGVASASIAKVSGVA